MVGPGRYGREGTFRDRHEAGRLLGERLAELRSERPVVLALPRGGVPVAAEVARALDAPLDVIVVRKLGVPFQPEVGFGAIGEGGVRLFDSDLIRRARITEREVAEVEARERAELERRVRLYRGDRPPLPVAGRTVVIVDDGLATGVADRLDCLQRIANPHPAAQRDFGRRRNRRAVHPRVRVRNSDLDDVAARFDQRRHGRDRGLDIRESRWQIADQRRTALGSTRLE